MAGWRPPADYYGEGEEPKVYGSARMKLRTRDCRHVHPNQAKPFIYCRPATKEELKDA